MGHKFGFLKWLSEVIQTLEQVGLSMPGLVTFTTNRVTLHQLTSTEPGPELQNIGEIQVQEETPFKKFEITS